MRRAKVQRPRRECDARKLEDERDRVAARQMPQPSAGVQGRVPIRARVLGLNLGRLTPLA